MPKIIKKEEILGFEGIVVSDFIKKEFLEKIANEKLDMIPISLIFIANEKKDGKEREYPIIIGHTNKEEFSKKILLINAPVTETSEKFIKLLETLVEEK